MRYKSYLALFICLLTLSCDDTIDPDTSGKFIKFYGGAHNETAYAVEELPQGGYVIVGSTDSLDNGDKDLLVIRTDANGNRIQQGKFNKGMLTFGGALPDEGKSLLIDASGNISILGYATKKNSTDTDFFFVRIDANGNKLDSLLFGNTPDMEEGYSLIPAKNGGYLLIGSAPDTDATQADKGNIRLVKLQPDLQKVFERTYGLTDRFDSLAAIREGEDGTLAWSGTVQRGSSRDIRVVLSDSYGNLITDTPYGDNTHDEIGADIQKIYGRYVVVGTSMDNTVAPANTDILLINVNADGSLIQQTVINIEGNQYARAIYPTNDGNYIITGRTIAEEKSDILLLKTTRQGDILWQKSFGGAGADEGTFVKQTADGGYIILATVEIENNTVIGLIKTDAEGKSLGSLAK